MSSKIEIRRISVHAKNNAAFIKKWADLLDYHSWGSRKDPYPKKAMDEISHVLVAFVALVDGKFGGAACVTDVHSSPDGQDRDAMYFALAVVHPRYEKMGIWGMLYARRMEWIQGRPGRVVSTGENFRNMHRLAQRGWKLVRFGFNEKGESFLMMELPRK